MSTCLLEHKLWWKRKNDWWLSDYAVVVYLFYFLIYGRIFAHCFNVVVYCLYMNSFTVAIASSCIFMTVFANVFFFYWLFQKCFYIVFSPLMLLQFFMTFFLYLFLLMFYLFVCMERIFVFHWCIMCTSCAIVFHVRFFLS